MKTNHPEARVRSDIAIERVVDNLSDSSSPSLGDSIKGHWLSSILIIAYGSIAWSNSPSQLVVFLGIITVVFAIQSEVHVRRSREYKQIENALRELLALVREQEVTRQIEQNQAEQDGGGNAPEPPSHPSTARPKARATP